MNSNGDTEKYFIFGYLANLFLMITEWNYPGTKFSPSLYLSCLAYDSSQINACLNSKILYIETFQM